MKTDRAQAGAPGAWKMICGANAARGGGNVMGMGWKIKVKENGLDGDAWLE